MQGKDVFRQMHRCKWMDAMDIFLQLSVKHRLSYVKTLFRLLLSTSRQVVHSAQQHSSQWTHEKDGVTGDVTSDELVSTTVPPVDVWDTVDCLRLRPPSFTLHASAASVMCLNHLNINKRPLLLTCLFMKTGFCLCYFLPSDVQAVTEDVFICAVLECLAY